MFVENGQQQQEQTVTYKQSRSFLGCRAKAFVQVLLFFFESSFCANRLCSSFGNCVDFDKMFNAMCSRQLTDDWKGEAKLIFLFVVWAILLMIRQTVDFSAWSVITQVGKKIEKVTFALATNNNVRQWNVEFVNDHKRWLQTVSSENVLHMKTVKDKCRRCLLFAAHTNASLQTLDEIHAQRRFFSSSSPSSQLINKKSLGWKLCLSSCLFFKKIVGLQQTVD